MLKFVGCIAILLSCYMASSFIAGAERKRIEHTEHLIVLLKYIRRRIDCCSLPIGVILRECRDDILSKLGVKGNVTDLSQIINGAETALTKESKKILNDFSREFGRSHRQDQVRLCDNTVEALSAHKNALMSAYPTKRRTTTALCFAIGGMLLIALL